MNREDRFKIPAWATLVVGAVINTVVFAGIVDARYETKDRFNERKVDIDRRLERIEDKIDRLIELRNPEGKNAHGH